MTGSTIAIRKSFRRSGIERETDLLERIHSYPKIYAIGHGAIADLFHGENLLVEEKVDGSQFSFSKTPEGLVFRSRGAVVYPETAGMFLAGVNSVIEIADRLHEGWVYRGEYLQKPKHNTLAYGRVPKYHTILFDVNTGEEVYLSREEKEAEAERIGMEIVPCLYCGPVKSPEQFYRLLERESILGTVKIEGIVVKNYARFGLDKKVLMGKYVSEEFKESHGKEWKASNPEMGDVVDRIIATVRNEQRWRKSVQRLRDAGQLDNSPRDIGLLIKEIQSDVKAEESEFIAKKLIEYALPRVLRACTGGMPEWYKKQLLESAFSEVTDSV
jgi:hypothetical protein